MEFGCLLIYSISVVFLITYWGKYSSKKLPLHRTDITRKLQELCLAGVLIAEGHGRGCVYRLKTLRLQAQDAKVATSEGERLQAQEVRVATSEGERLQPRSKLFPIS